MIEQHYTAAETQIYRSVPELLFWETPLRRCSHWRFGSRNLKIGN